MNISIEKAKPSDAKEILELTKVFGSESDNLTYGKEGIKATVESEAKYLKSLQDDSSNIFLLAKIDGKIIGTANYSTYSKERLRHRGEFGICVLKKYWNNGIGQMLLEKILYFAKESAKSDIVSLEVRSDNLSAIHLYKKFGFEKVGTFKGYFKINNEYIDFDIMQLILKDMD